LHENTSQEHHANVLVRIFSRIPVLRRKEIRSGFERVDGEILKSWGTSACASWENKTAITVQSVVEPEVRQAARKVFSSPAQAKQFLHELSLFARIAQSLRPALISVPEPESLLSRTSLYPLIALGFSACASAPWMAV